MLVIESAGGERANRRERPTITAQHVSSADYVSVLLVVEVAVELRLAGGGRARHLERRCSSVSVL